MTVKRQDGSTEDVVLKSRIDTQDELDYYQHGGILQFVLQKTLR